MASADKHRFKCLVEVRLSKELDLELKEICLREGRELQSVVGQMLGIMSEIADAENEFRIVPDYPLECDSDLSHSVRLPDEVHDSIKRHAQEVDRTMSFQAAEWIAVAVGLYKRVSGRRPLRREETKRRMKRELDRQWGRTGIRGLFRSFRRVFERR